MMSHNALLDEIDDLRSQFERVANALAEAEVRFAALSQRGPMVVPDMGFWMQHRNSLCDDILVKRREVQTYLKKIGWKELGIPSTKKERDSWWASVRAYVGRVTTERRVFPTIDMPF